MKWIHALITLAVLCTVSRASANSNLVLENGNLADRTATDISNMPAQWRNLGEGTTYSDPTQNEVTDFLNTIFSPLYNKSFETAATNALAMDYRLVAFTDNTDSHTYYILERDPASMANNFWGTYVFNPSPDRGQLIIQSPHPAFDTNTGKQGAYVFRQVGAGFFFLSGTHRCSSPTPSGCSGFSSVCSNTISGEDAPQEFIDEGNVFRESDMAHNEASMYQHVTQWVQDQNPGYYFFIQLHGFSQNLDPHVILSNGRDENTTPPQDDKLTVFRTQLIQEWDDCANSNISLDIEVAHDDADNNFNSLLGTTNTQGRYINGSVTPCTQAATVNTGNFFHVEMAKKNGDFLLRDEANFPILGKALINTFLEAPLPIELIEFKGKAKEDKVVLSWITAWEINNSHFEVQRSKSGHKDFKTVGIVPGRGTDQDLNHYHWHDEEPCIADQNRLYYRLKQTDFNGTFEFSEVIGVTLKPFVQSHKPWLTGNQGDGTTVVVELPEAYIRKNIIEIRIVNPAKGQVFSGQYPANEIQAILREQLLRHPTGLYIITLSLGDSHLTERFLRF